MRRIGVKFSGLLAGALLASTALMTASIAAPAAPGIPPAQQAQEVDVALVLAIDISGSIDYQEAELQRKGIAEAFLSKEVLQAIQAGSLGRWCSGSNRAKRKGPRASVSAV